MALSAGRMVLYLLGTLLVIGALLMFFFESGLDRWVPVSMLIAGILLILGLSVMGFADRAPAERTHRVRDYDDDDVTVIKRH